MIDQKLYKKDSKFWKGKLAIAKRDITNRGGETILKGTYCKIISKDRMGFHISTDVGKASIRIMGVKPEDLEFV